MKYLVGEKQFDSLAEAQEYERELYEAKKVDPLDELSYVYRVKNTYTEEEMHLVVFNDSENTTQELRDLVIAYSPNNIATPHLKDGFPFVSIEVTAVKDKEEKSKILSKIKPITFRGRNALYSRDNNLFVIYNNNVVNDSFSEEPNTILNAIVEELFSFGR